MIRPPFAVPLALVLLVASVAATAAEPVSKSRLGGVAIGGHDPVAYRGLPVEPRGEAVEGDKSYAVEHLGATWRFASEEDAAAFEADPDRYVPAYNGHCANALSLGEGLIRTDGTHWEIFDGDDRLYLFYAGRGRDPLDRWRLAGLSRGGRPGVGGVDRAEGAFRKRGVGGRGRAGGTPRGRARGERVRTRSRRLSPMGDEAIVST